MKKLNCWEYMRCGRELGGHTRHLGICPSVVAMRLNGVHSGTHGGRACWVVAGTLCNGKGHESFAEKYHACEQCGFYKTVRKEEGGQFVLAAVLLQSVSRLDRKDREGGAACLCNVGRGKLTEPQAAPRTS